MKKNSLYSIIPMPAFIEERSGSFKVSELKSYSLPKEASEKTEMLLKELFNKYTMRLVEQPAEKAQLILKIDSSLAVDNFSVEITVEKIEIVASSSSSLSYGINALDNMLSIACASGLIYGELDCGIICDRPRFNWRGFMLDSARHFQDVAMVKTVLDIMAKNRLNIFHWHLVDSQSWRYESKVVPNLSATASIAKGSYSSADIREICEYAKSLGIAIVPEVDVPGHSLKILSEYSEFTCINSENSSEFCLGNPKTLPFIKQIFDELIELFPDSEYIHIGGDEANTNNWDNCPLCQKAISDNNLHKPRELEHKFMQAVSDYIISKNRKPIMWGCNSDLTYSPNITVQAWLDMREPIMLAANGNPVIYSLHNSLYFDYPLDLNEPHENWMFRLSEEDVYMTEPHIIWPEKVESSIIGMESCLWTETVPQWRLLRKILPRISAYSEVTWSMPEKRDWHDFSRRRQLLKACN